MPLYLQERQIKIWQFSSELSTEENVMAALTKMACFRQAAMDDATLESYTMALKDLDLRAFQVAMAIIAESRRSEGETAFPELGRILEIMDAAREVFPAGSRKELNTAPITDRPRISRFLR